MSDKSYVDQAKDAASAAGTLPDAVDRIRSTAFAAVPCSHTSFQHLAGCCR